jgi:hypothetical protein
MGEYGDNALSKPAPAHERRLLLAWSHIYPLWIVGRMDPWRFGNRAALHYRCRCIGWQVLICSGFVHVEVLIREGLSELGSLRLEFVQFHWRRG